MTDTHFCLQCSAKIEINDIKCPHCGFNQYGENNEFYPDKKAYRNIRKYVNGSVRKQKGFSDEEILALGLYPKDKGYKVSLLSRILGK